MHSPLSGLVQKINNTSILPRCLATSDVTLSAQCLRLTLRAHTRTHERKTVTMSGGQQDPGPDPSQVGYYSVKAYHDVTAMTDQPQQGAMFASGTDQDINTIRANELVYRRPNQSSTLKKSRDPYVVSSLNGQGAEARMLFPDDEDARVDYLNQQLDVVGVASGSVSHPKSNPGMAFAVQIEGVKPVFAGEQLYFGQLACWSVPKQAEQRARTQPTGTSPLKVTIIVKHYDQTTVAHKFRRAVRDYLRDPKRFVAYQEKRYGKLALNAAVLAMTNASLMDGLMFLYRAVRAGIVQFVSGSQYEMGQARGANTEEIVLGMAQALGLLGNMSIPINNINIDGEVAKRFERFGFEALNTQYWDGTIMNHGFAYDPTRRTNPGQNDRKQVDLTSPYGLMLMTQLQAHARSMSSHNEFITQDRKQVLGRVVAAARPGETAGVL